MYSSAYQRTSISRTAAVRLSFHVSFRTSREQESNLWDVRDGQDRADRPAGRHSDANRSARAQQEDSDQTGR